jgi:hypothetical protein
MPRSNKNTTRLKVHVGTNYILYIYTFICYYSIIDILYKTRYDYTNFNMFYVKIIKNKIISIFRFIKKEKKILLFLSRCNLE